MENQNGRIREINPLSSDFNLKSPLKLLASILTPEQRPITFPFAEWQTVVSKSALYIPYSCRYSPRLTLGSFFRSQMRNQKRCEDTIFFCGKMKVEEEIGFN
jgi:hypothetical protein